MARVDRSGQCRRLIEDFMSSLDETKAHLIAQISFVDRAASLEAGMFVANCGEVDVGARNPI